jgi:hypothetical protein
MAAVVRRTTDIEPILDDIPAERRAPTSKRNRCLPGGCHAPQRRPYHPGAMLPLVSKEMYEADRKAAASAAHGSRRLPEPDADRCEVAESRPVEGQDGVEGEHGQVRVKSR